MGLLDPRRVVILALLAMLTARAGVGEDAQSAANAEAMGRVLAAPSAAKPATATLGDVYAHLKKLEGDVNLVRIELGQPRVKKVYVTLTQISPRELQALARLLLRKMARLYDEQTRVVAEVSHDRKPETGNFELLETIEKSQALIDRLKEDLMISEKTPLPPVDSTKSKEDVAQLLQLLNRQTNELFLHGYTPRDVFAEVTLALSYVSRVRELYPESEMLMEPVPLERGKRPRDVMQRLIDCHLNFQQIAAEHGFSVVQITPTLDETDWVDPSDVYDVAALLVEDMAFLHSQFPDAKGARIVYDPGRKFPSLVYQRAGLLNNQIDEIERLLKIRTPPTLKNAGLPATTEPQSKGGAQ